MIFQLSSSGSLWGFRLDLTIDHFVSLQTLLSFYKEQLIYTLKLYNLEILIEEAKKLTLHIHGCTTLDELRAHILTLNSERIVYICNHC